MTAVTINGNTLEVDAAIVAAGLHLEPETLRVAMQDGTVTSVCETGAGSDAGRFRITFFAPSRRMRLVVDLAGNILQHASSDFIRRPKK